MSDVTIFDRILSGEIPSHKLYEDEHVLAFLDVFPLSYGHTLLIPKERCAYLHELSDEAGSAIGRTLPRLARAVVEATGATAYNVLQNNGSAAHQAVFHVHFHIIPKTDERGLGIGWSPGSLEDEDAARLVDSILGVLERPRGDRRRGVAMKAWQIDGAFGLDNLRLVERQRPSPGPGELLLCVEAVSLNSRDVQMIEGVYNPRQALPLVPCSDAVGRVEEVGEGVAEWSEGERVCTTLTPRWVGGAPSREVIRSTLGGPLDGTLREYMVLPAGGVVACPGNLSAVEGSTLGCAGLTAWNAMVTEGGLTAGGTVLALGTGGVSIFVLQLAGILGARAIVTSSSDEKLERARKLGAWKTINYVDTPEWGREVQGLTGGQGVDVVVEIGGAATLPQSIRAVGIGGTVALVGVVSARQGPLNVVPIFMRQIRLQGILVGHRQSFEAMNRAVESCDLHPVVDRVFPFDEGPEALRYLQSGRHFGKVCIAGTTT